LLTQHVQGNNHKAKTEQKGNTKQTLLRQTISGRISQFFSDICKALVAANIHWIATQHPKFKTFLEKYCNQIIPFGSAIRKDCLKPAEIETIAAV
jgi:hypothetical protein